MYVCLLKVLDDLVGHAWLYRYAYPCHFSLSACLPLYSSNFIKRKIPEWEEIIVTIMLVERFCGLFLHECRPSNGGSMNSVRTMGPETAASNYRALWIYLIAPTLGALAGAVTYSVMKGSSGTKRPTHTARPGPSGTRVPACLVVVETGILSGPDVHVTGCN